MKRMGFMGSPSLSQDDIKGNDLKKERLMSHCSRLMICVLSTQKRNNWINLGCWSLLSDYYPLGIPVIYGDLKVFYFQEVFRYMDSFVSYLCIRKFLKSVFSIKLDDFWRNKPVGYALEFSCYSWITVPRRQLNLSYFLTEKYFIVKPPHFTIKFYTNVNFEWVRKEFNMCAVF